jgi:hypothetical protein
MKTISAICIALLLSACGGGHSASPYTGTPPPPVTPPAPTDAFFAAVAAYLTPTSDSTDATPIDAVVATQPDNTEPSELN